MPHYRKIHIYRDSHLPSKGWLQSCFSCYMFTSSTVDYKKIKHNKDVYDFVVYLCPTCIKEVKSISDKKFAFMMRCDRYINNLLAS